MIKHLSDLKKRSYKQFTNFETAVLTVSPLLDFKWDYMSQVATSSTVDTFTFKYGGSGGTTVGVIVITYTDSTKATISTVERTT